MAFNYFYKQFETIRIIIRRLYLYGCYNRDDFKNIVSGRKFDNELKRAKMVINPNNITQSYKGKSKYTSINYDYFSDNKNVLADTYFAKAFNSNEFILYFYVLQLLKKSDLSLADIELKLSQYIPDIDRATIRNHLEKMCTEGYLSFSTQKNKKIYAISRDLLDEFEDDELYEVLTAISFYSNTALMQMPGKYCYDTVLEHSNIEHNTPFVFRHKYLHQILDEDILQQIISAIEERKGITFLYNGVKRENISPITIQSDNYFGRQYLVGLDISNSRLSIFRIDKISNVTKGTIFADISSDMLKNCWCVSWKPQHSPVSIIFKFNESADSYLIQRLFRDKKHGTVKKISSEKYMFTIDVTDPIEMVPWLRTFYGYIVEIDSEILRSYLIDDMKRMVNMYESI